MTPLTPANLAAIERRAAAATEALARPAGALYVEQSLSAADVPALLRHIAALQAQHAGEVAAAEDALTTAREERDAARSALDELVAAVRVEREGRVVHNYGHGGSGYTLCWGCAEDVVGMVGG